MQLAASFRVLLFSRNCPLWKSGATESFCSAMVVQKKGNQGG
jgi:hypothetical protein